MAALVYNPAAAGPSRPRPLATPFPFSPYTTLAGVSATTRPTTSPIPVPALPPIPRRRKRRVHPNSSLPTSVSPSTTSTVQTTTTTTILSTPARTKETTNSVPFVSGKPTATTTVVSKSFYLTFPQFAPTTSSTLSSLGSSRGKRTGNGHGSGSGEKKKVSVASIAVDSSPSFGALGLGGAGANVGRGKGRCPCDLCENVDEPETETDADGVTVTVRSVSVERSPGPSPKSSLSPILKRRANATATRSPTNTDVSSFARLDAQTTPSTFTPTSTSAAHRPSRSPREDDLLAPGEWESITLSRRGSRKTLADDAHPTTPPNSESTTSSNPTTTPATPTATSSRSLFNFEPTPSLSPSTPFLPLFRRHASRSRSRGRTASPAPGGTTSATSASQSASPSPDSSRRASKANSLKLDLSLAFDDEDGPEEHIIPRPGAALLSLLLEPAKGCWSPDYEEVGEVVDSGVWAWEGGQVVISRPNPAVEAMHSKPSSSTASKRTILSCPLSSTLSHPLDARVAPLALALPFPRRAAAPTIPLAPAVPALARDDPIVSSVCMLRLDVPALNRRVHPTSPLAEGLGRSAEQVVSATMGRPWASGRSSSRMRGQAGTKMDKAEGEAVVKATRKAQDVEALRVQVLEWAMVRSGKLSAVRVRP